MRDTLAELVVDSTASLTALVGLSELLDSADGGDREADEALRLLTPVCKAHLTERRPCHRDRGYGGEGRRRLYRGLA